MILRLLDLIKVESELRYFSHLSLLIDQSHLICIMFSVSCVLCSALVPLCHTTCLLLAKHKTIFSSCHVMSSTLHLMNPSVLYRYTCYRRQQNFVAWSYYTGVSSSGLAAEVYVLVCVCVCHDKMRACVCVWMWMCVYICVYVCVCVTIRCVCVCHDKMSAQQVF